MDTDISVEIARLYVSFFHRAPDPEGLQYWMARYEEEVANGQDADLFLESIADSFAQSPEAKAIYETVANPTQAQLEDYVSEAYNNLFGREPDAEGLAYWTGRWQTEVEAGRPGVRVLFEIENAARGSSNANDVAALQNKAEVAAKFTTDFIASGATWTQADMNKAGTLLEGVDHTPASVEKVNQENAEYIDDRVTPVDPGPVDPGPVDPGPVDPGPVDPNPTDPDAALLAKFNAAEGADLIALIRANDAKLGVEMNFPVGGGRESAVGLGVAEFRDLFGDYTSLFFLQSAVQLHEKIELTKQNALSTLFGEIDQTEFISTVTALVSDRAEVIDYYSQWAEISDSDPGRARVAELKGEKYTTVLDDLIDYDGKELYEAFLDARGAYSGSIDNLIAKLGLAIEDVKADIAAEAALVAEFNAAGDELELVALIRENADELDYELDLLPAGGGREKAVGLGVEEVRDLFGGYTSLAEIRKAVEAHLGVEYGKQLALQDLYSTTDAAVFALRVARLNDDRQEIIRYYKELAGDSTVGRIGELEAEPYTVDLKAIIEAVGSEEISWEAIFAEFQSNRGEYSGNIVTLVNKLDGAFDAVIEDAFVADVNAAFDFKDMLVAIKSDEGFATQLDGIYFPDGGGREEAVGLGVVEHIDLTGVFTSFNEAQSVVSLHIRMEENKAEFIAESGDITAVDYAASLKENVISLHQDRQDVIDLYEAELAIMIPFSMGFDPVTMTPFPLPNPMYLATSEHISKLNNDPFTKTLSDIVDYASGQVEGEDAFWVSLANAFQGQNSSYTGSVVTLVGRLDTAFDQVVPIQ